MCNIIVSIGFDLIDWLFPIGWKESEFNWKIECFNDDVGLAIFVIGVGSLYVRIVLHCRRLHILATFPLLEKTWKDGEGI